MVLKRFNLDSDVNRWEFQVGLQILQNDPKVAKLRTISNFQVKISRKSDGLEKAEARNKSSTPQFLSKVRYI